MNHAIIWGCYHLGRYIICRGAFIWGGVTGGGVIIWKGVIVKGGVIIWGGVLILGMFIIDTIWGGVCYHWARHHHLAGCYHLGKCHHALFEKQIGSAGLR